MRGEVTTGDLRRYMATEVHNVTNATQLAENAAHEFGHDEWLDDETHEVWEVAIEVF